MPLINCKIKLKLKWTNQWVLGRLGVNKSNVNDNNIFTIKHTNLYVHVTTLPAKSNQKYENFSVWNISLLEWIQRKNENDNTANEYRYFLESKLVGVNGLFVFIYPNEK